MIRLTRAEKNKIKSLVKKKKSLNQISQELRIKKTTVYYHFRKTKGMTISRPKIKIQSDIILGEIIGIFSGDGSQYFEPKGYHYQNRIHFGKKNIEYALYVKKLYEKFFGKTFILKRDGETKLILETHSKEIYKFFHTYISFVSKDKSHTIFLRRDHASSKKFVTGFLKGLLDTDGTVAKIKNGIRIAYYTSSPILAQQISALLLSLGIKNNMSKISTRKSQYQVYVFKEYNAKLLDLMKPYKGR